MASDWRAKDRKEHWCGSDRKKWTVGGVFQTFEKQSSGSGQHIAQQMKPGEFLNC